MIFFRVAAFCRAFFQNVLVLNIHLDSVSYIYDIFYNKYKIPHIQNAYFQIDTVKVNTIGWHCNKSDSFRPRV